VINQVLEPLLERKNVKTIEKTADRAKNVSTQAQKHQNDYPEIFVDRGN
jgi:hypothetical protein